MPTELEQQIARFAEALDQEAPAISVDEILSRGAVAVGETGEFGTTIELVPKAARPGERRPMALKIVLAVAAAAVLVVAVGAIVRNDDGSTPGDTPTSTVPTPLPITTEPITTEPITTEPITTEPITTEPITTPATAPESAAPTSGGMWPQSTVEEVSAAQALADAGDSTYTWQVDPSLTLYEELTVDKPGQVELVDRFLREVLGWEAYMFNPRQSVFPDGSADGVLPDLRYLRCAPGRTNPLYPPQPDSEEPGELCAPTLDDQRFESVGLDLAQLDRQGRDGIWVVDRWELTAPFAQDDPAVVEEKARERLEGFLAARIAGRGAEGHVEIYHWGDVEVPLLYAASSGAAYERYEIERVDGPHWPDGRGTFRVRMFADGDATMVEQEIGWNQNQSGWLFMDSIATTENGEPVVVSHTSPDGEVSVSVPTTWETWLPGKVDDWDVGASDAAKSISNVWFGGVWHREDGFGSGEHIGFVDPVAYDAWCAAYGGSPLLTAPADAEAIAQQVAADSDFETTEPVATRIGGLDALSIDVAMAPGGKTCGIGVTDISRWIHELWEPGLRLRLYLVDLPDGMAVETLAITVVAPEERFDEVIAETKPIIDSIEFHPQTA